MTNAPIDFLSVDDKDVVGVLMQGILDHVVTYYEQENVDLPERRYIHVGATAHDCEQFVVSFVQMYLGPPGNEAEEAQPCTAPRSVVLTVEVTRKVAIGGSGRGGTTPPNPEHVTEHTLTKVQDAWILMSSVLDYGPIAQVPIVTDISITQPSGGMQSVVLHLSIQVP